MSNSVDLRAYSYNGLDEPIIAHCFAVEELETVYDNTSYCLTHTMNGEKSYCKVSISHNQIVSIISVEILVENIVREALYELGIKRESFEEASRNGDFYREIKRFYENRLRTLLSKRRSGVEVDECTAEV